MTVVKRETNAGAASSVRKGMFLLWYCGIGLVDRGLEYVDCKNDTSQGHTFFIRRKGI